VISHQSEDCTRLTADSGLFCSHDGSDSPKVQTGFGGIIKVDAELYKLSQTTGSQNQDQDMKRNRDYRGEKPWKSGICIGIGISVCE
jgi:hypothetical protein